MRRVCLLLFAVGYLACGAYVFFLCVINPNIYGMFFLDLGSAFSLMAFGLYLLWDDFLRPHIPTVKSKPSRGF